MSAALYAVPTAPGEAGDPSEGRLPPHDLDAEAAVLSATLVAAQSQRGAELAKAIPWLRPEDFYSESHRRMWEASLAVVTLGGEPDLVQIATWLKNRNRLGQIDGGMAYMTEVLNAAPSLENIQHYAKIVHDKARVRRTISICQGLAVRGYFDYGEAQSFIDGGLRELLAISRAEVGGKVQSNAERLDKKIRRIWESYNRPEGDEPAVPLGVPTGIEAVDRMTLGLAPGSKTTVAALTGCGKTSFAVQAAVSAARSGVGVVYFTTVDETVDEMDDRFYAHLARIDGKRIVQGKLTATEWSRLLEAHEVYKKLPIRILSDTDTTPEAVRARTLLAIDSLRIEYGATLGLVVVDCVQNLGASPTISDRAKPHDRIDYASKFLKNMAMELKVAVLELAQRKLVQVDNATKARPKPGPNDFRDCGSIGMHSNTVIFLHALPRYVGQRVEGEDKTAIMAVIPKARGRSTGERRLHFICEQQRFESIDLEEYGGGS